MADNEEQETVVVDTAVPQSPEQTWEYSAEEKVDPTPSIPAVDPVAWTASEFIQHDKGAGWYLILGCLGAVIVGLIYLFTQDIFASVVVVMVLVLFAIAAKRKPRTLRYEITPKGITIGEKHYPFTQFKSFTVLEEGAFNSIQLLSLKRFMPPISLYCPPEQEELVVNALGNYLPHETRNHDLVDRLMNKIHF